MLMAKGRTKTYCQFYKILKFEEKYLKLTFDYEYKTIWKKLKNNIKQELCFKRKILLFLYFYISWKKIVFQI